MSTQVAADHLLTHTKLEEEGRGAKGYGRSERRLCLGGSTWRQFEPRASSVLWGMDYETWQFNPGLGGIEWAADHLRHVAGVRPSRVDVAFDFACDPSFTSCELVELAEVVAHCKDRGIIADGISGQGSVFTRYIGSVGSERRLRIYRKDLQDEILGAMLGPTIRVEVELKGGTARSWWEAWTRDKGEAYTRAAGDVLALSGLRVLPEARSVPEASYPQTGAAERLVAFVRQYGSMLVAARRAGVDLDRLAAEHVAGMSRASKYRHEKLVADLSREDPAALECMVSSVLR